MPECDNCAGRLRFSIRFGSAVSAEPNPLRADICPSMNNDIRSFSLDLKSNIKFCCNGFDGQNRQMARWQDGRLYKLNVRRSEIPAVTHVEPRRQEQGRSHSRLRPG